MRIKDLVNEQGFRVHSDIAEFILDSSLANPEHFLNVQSENKVNGCDKYT